MRVIGLGAGAIVLGILVACAPAPPLEVISEPTDFTAGVTVEPIAGPDPVAPADGGVAPINEPAPSPDPVGQPDFESNDPVQEPTFDVVLEGEGLTERLPNTCKLENYQQYVGQNAAVITSAGLDRPWRIVLPDTIVTQEYNPARLNFRANANGVIQQITCG